MDETAIVQQLHNLALSIAEAKQAGNDAAAQQLAVQFGYWADQYRGIGGTNTAVLELINKVSDVASGVVGSAQALVQTAGQVAGSTVRTAVTSLLKPLVPIILLALVAVLAWVFWPKLVRAGGRR